MAAKREVAIAILYRDNQYLMQLRDDIPDILFPGCWAFFGGHLDPGEDADTAIYRELEEEICYKAPHLELFSRVEAGGIIRNVYHGPLVVPVSELQLNEGWDMALWSLEDIQRGERYSAKAGAVKPMEAPHRNILRSFLEHRRIEQAS